MMPCDWIGGRPPGYPFGLSSWMLTYPSVGTVIYLMMYQLFSPPTPPITLCHPLNGPEWDILNTRYVVFTAFIVFDLLPVFFYLACDAAYAHISRLAGQAGRLGV